MLISLLRIRIRALVSGMFNRSVGSKKRGMGIKILIAFLAVYVVAAFLAMSTGFFYALCKPLVTYGLGWFYFALAGIMVFILDFIGSIFATQTQIFEAKDNDLLLSMPIKSSAILASRMALLLFLNYLFELFVMLPAGIIWCVYQPVTAVGVLFFILSILLLPLMALALSSLVGWLLALVSSRIRNKNLVTMILSLAFLMAYFWVFSRISNYITLLLANGTAIAAAIQKAVFPMYHMGVAITSGSVVSMLYFILCAVIPFVIVYNILSRNFVKIATTNRGSVKIKYRETALRVSGVETAFVKKELRHFLSNPMYIMNTALGLIFMVVMAVILVVKRDLIMNVLAQFPVQNFPLAPMVTALLCLLTATNFISAPSVSLEGNNLWIAKSLPVRPSDVLNAKAVMHIVVSAPFIAVSAVIGAIAVSATITQTLLMLVLPMAATVFFAFMGVALNLRFPKLDWISETVAIKQGISSLLAMFGAVAILVLLGAIYFFLLSNVMSPDVYLLLCTVLFAILSLELYLFMKGGGSRIFESL